MSLLEDIFLQDEADEAQELERIIEGDDLEYERRQISDSDDDNNSRKDDEAEEDKRTVDPQAAAAKKARVVKNPRFVLNPARLTGPRGIHVIPEHFKDFKFKGKRHEKEDLDMVLKKLEHWAYRLYPKFRFEDCLKKIEQLGKKKAVMVNLHKIRSDQFVSEEIVVQKDSSDDEKNEEQEVDEFDKLLQQQIELAKSTPISAKKPGFGTPGFVPRTPGPVTSSPSLSEEQKERMIRNRKLAEERRLAKLQQNTTNTENKTVDLTNGTNIDKSSIIEEKDQDKITDVDLTNTNSPVKRNQKRLISSSDDDDVLMTSKTVEVNKSNIIEEKDEGNISDVDLTKDNSPVKRTQKRLISSSDDESDDVLMTSKTVEVNIDVHGSNNRSFTKRKQIIDSSDDSNDAVVITKETDKNNSPKDINSEDQRKSLDSLGGNSGVETNGKEKVVDLTGNIKFLNSKEVINLTDKIKGTDDTTKISNIVEINEDSANIIDEDTLNKNNDHLIAEVNNDGIQKDNVINENETPDDLAIIHTSPKVVNNSNESDKENVDSETMDIDFTDEF